jgi:hypothetical protein
MCSMLYVIYDLEGSGSNDANPQGANLIPVGEIYFPGTCIFRSVLFGLIPFSLK